MSSVVKRFFADKCGATAIEYGLIAGILGVGLVIGLTSMKDALVTLFSSFGDKF
jgi:pilus assembly protein Flp/PilA